MTRVRVYDCRARDGCPEEVWAVKVEDTWYFGETQAQLMFKVLNGHGWKDGAHHAHAHAGRLRHPIRTLRQRNLLPRAPMNPIRLKVRNCCVHGPYPGEVLAIMSGDRWHFGVSQAELLSSILLGPGLEMRTRPLHAHAHYALLAEYELTLCATSDC